MLEDRSQKAETRIIPTSGFCLLTFFSYLCLVKKIVLTIVTLFLWIASFAQSHKDDSTSVFYYPISFDSITLNAPKHTDTATFHANDFDLLSHDQTIYSTLSNIGMAHHPMRFHVSPVTGFNLELPAFSQYIKTEKDLKTYLSLLPYSEIRYVMSFGNKEQHLNFKFARQFEKGLFLSFEYNINSSPGTYINNDSNNNYFWINALYSTKDQRYRALAYWFRNKIEVQENGGIIDDNVYVEHQESDNSAILTNLSNATNYIKVSGAGFKHYFNLLPQYKTTQVTLTDTLAMDSISRLVTDSIPSPVADSIPPTTVVDSVSTRKFTFGRINHSFAFQRNQLFYNETSANLPFYASYDTLLNAATTDTTIVQIFHNSLYWNSLGYQNYSNNVPIFVYAGIDYDIFNIKRYDYLDEKVIKDQRHSQVSLKGGIIINLFKSTTITGKAKLVTLGYQIGDFNINGQWRQFFGTRERNFGKLTVDFDMKRQSPTWFESKYQSNHFRWDNDFHAATYLIFGANYRYKIFSVGVKHTAINDLIYFNQQARPEQYDGFTSISEVYGNVNVTLGRFKIEGYCTLQKAGNEDIVHLPLFLGKLKIGFEQPLFKRATILEPSITVNYFTKYYADAYMPALRTFYLQDEVLIGNYPFIDLALAINIKKADIFLQYSNMFLLTGNRNSFIAPHYPLRNSKIFFGVNWRLFN